MLSFSAPEMIRECNEATVAQMVEQLICNQRVGGSIPFGGSRERFPSGQREQTVNLPAKPSEVRILPSPPAKFALHSLPIADKSYELRVLGNEVFSIHSELPADNFELDMCGSSSVVERQPSKLRVAGSNPVSRSITA